MCECIIVFLVEKNKLSYSKNSYWSLTHSNFRYKIFLGIYFKKSSLPS